MNNPKSILLSVATVCLAFTIFLYQWLLTDSGILNTSSGIRASVPAYLTSIGFYILIFTFLVWLTEKLLYPFITRNSSLDGKWYYIQQINSDQSYRFGYCEINHGLDLLVLSGVHEEIGDKTFGSRWHSDAAVLNNKRLIVAFESSGAKTFNRIRKGLMILNVYGTPPKELIGYWSDILPSEANGPLHLFREKTKYEERVNNIKSSNNKKSFVDTKK